MDKQIRQPLILVAEDDIGIVEHFKNFLSKYGRADSSVALTVQSAIIELEIKEFDFVICDGTGWQTVHEILTIKMPNRFLIYTGDRTLLEELQAKGVMGFLKGATYSPDKIADFVLTKLKDEGFDCSPWKEIREFSDD